MMDVTTKRNLYAASVLVLSLSYMPAIGPMLSNILNYSIAGTEISVGVVIAAVGVWVAYQLYQRRI